MGLQYKRRGRPASGCALRHFMLRLDPSVMDALVRAAARESAAGGGTRVLTAQDVARRAIDMYLRGAAPPSPTSARNAEATRAPSPPARNAKITRPMLKWPGGKWRLGKWIASWFPAHDTYVEPFGGAASVLLQKEPCRREVYNDLDPCLLSLVRVLQCEALTEELLRRLAGTFYISAEFRAAWDPESADPVERARRLLVRAGMGHGPSGGPMVKRTSFRLLTPGARTSPLQDWLKHPAELAKIAARLRRVRVESVDAVALLPRYDGPRTLFYVDPPYLPETRGQRADYRHEMTAEQHRKLLAALRKLKGMVVLSGYRSELYGRLLAGWVCHEKGAYADGGRKRTECVWLSPACASQLSAQGMPTRADDLRASPRRAPAPAGAVARKRSQGRA